MKDYSDYKWIKVKRHFYDPTKTWEENYKALESHHEKEALFLIAEVRSLAKEFKESKNAQPQE